MYLIMMFDLNKIERCYAMREVLLFGGLLSYLLIQLRLVKYMNRVYINRNKSNNPEK